MELETKKTIIDRHISTINNIIKPYGKIEGNICNGKEKIWVQKNLFKIGTRCNTLLEIGFNAGHSALHFLVSNPKLTLYSFDICTHTYVDPCYNYLKENFGDRITLIRGDSTVTVPQFFQEHPHIVFDGYYIDGGHSAQVATSDLTNCYKASKDAAWVVLDDTDKNIIYNLWIQFCNEGKIEPVDLYENGLFPTVGNKHQIGKFNKPAKPRYLPLRPKKGLIRASRPNF